MQERWASPDGRRLVQLEADGSARVRDGRTGAAVGPSLRHRGAITCAAFSPDGSRVATTGLDQAARVWDAVSGELVTPPLAHASVVTHVGFSPDGTRVVTASDDNTARVWAVATGELVLPPLRHHGTLLDVAFSADGRFLATGSKDQTARVWDGATGEALTPPLRHPWVVHQVRFSPDGGRLLTAGPGGQTGAWDLSPDGRPAEDLQALARVLAGNRVDDKRGLMPLEGPELRDAYAALRGRYPETFTPAPAEVSAWNREAAAECLRAGQWSGAVWHLDRLIRAEPGAWLYPALRALARAERGEWEEAGADLARAAERDPVAPEVWCLQALFRARAGDAAGYRRACAALLARDGSGDAHDAFLSAWACGLAPGGTEAALRPVRQAERAAAAAPHNPDSLATLGAVLYRAGQVEGAVRAVNEAMALRGPAPAAEEWLLLALARQSLGQAVEARQWLDRAAAWLDQPAAGEGPDALPWHRRLRLEMFRREAVEALNKGRPAGR